jgi:hypothetical protein
MQCDSAARLTQESRGFAPPTREGFAFSSAHTFSTEKPKLHCGSQHCLNDFKHCRQDFSRFRGWEVLLAIIGAKEVKTTINRDRILCAVP